MDIDEEDGGVGLSLFETYLDVLEHFACHGYVVLQNFLAKEQIRNLQRECDRLQHEHVLASGSVSTTSCILEPMGRFNNSTHVCRYDRESYCRERSAVFNNGRIGNAPGRHASFCSKLQDLLTVILGSDLCLLNEQYIVKPPNLGEATSFAWHRDADSMREKGIQQFFPYVSVWCPLDAITETNGGLSIISFQDAVVSGHSGQQFSAFREDTRKTFLKMAVGDMVVMSHDVWHCSSPNFSSAHRRAYMPQYSAGPITHGAPMTSGQNPERLVAYAVPLSGVSEERARSTSFTPP